jgi:hypothetical protein
LFPHQGGEVFEERRVLRERLIQTLDHWSILKRGQVLPDNDENLRRHSRYFSGDVLQERAQRLAELPNDAGGRRCRVGGQRMFRPQVEAEDEFSEYLALVGVGRKRKLERSFGLWPVQLDAQIADLGKPAVGVLQ